MTLRRTALTALFALLCAVALPMGAAELAPTEAPAVAQADAVTGEMTEVVDLEALLDDGREQVACNPTACNAQCEAQFGPFAAGYCNNGVCECAV